MSMKLNRIVVSLLVLGSLIINDVVAQDTTIIETFNFQDVSKRRGVYVFPDGTHSYRKILMKYTLKCDPQTGRDKYDCGEWDYDTYNYIYGHDGILDSTQKSQKLYLENGAATDSLNYITRPFYDYWQETQYSIRHTNTISIQKDTLGNGSKSTLLAFNSKNKVGRSQYVWKASELLSAGLSAGNITGIELDVNVLGSEMKNFEMKIGHTQMDSLKGGIFVDTGLTQVYCHNKKFANTGFNDLQFLAPFSWNGTDNIIVNFSFNGVVKGIDTELKSDSLSFEAGLAVAGSNSYLNFNGSPQWLNLKKDPTILGDKPRTIELWAKIDKFNNAGLFRAGTGGTGKDFSLRTTTKIDEFRIQLWGGDLNFSFPGALGNWHHYAMVYDGTKTMVYIDGNLVASKNFNLNTPAVDFQVGRWQGAFLFGQLDEIRVWDKALSSSTIKGWMGKSVDNLHPDFTNLTGYYPLDENGGKTVKDISARGNVDGDMSGIPTWKSFSVMNLFLNKKTTHKRPNVVFEKGIYTSVLDSSINVDSVARDPLNLIIYGNSANGAQIPENASNHPTIITRNILVWRANDFSNTYDKATSKRISWKYINADSSIKQMTKIWYSPEYRLEIGRFITPYGKGLDLGSDGFTWWYDVTDYVQHLRDSVDLQAGNTQELIDLKFLFIKGTPARDVVQLNRVWGQNRSYSYKSLDNDDNLKATSIDLHKNSKSYRVKTRFSGHGHNSTNGSYPHCCEWKDNTHSLWVNGTKFSDWHIWQKNECAENAVFPQGGTWPGAREGWCPGDIVKVNEFEISDKVSGNNVTLDYSITPVPGTNLGMGNGVYKIAVHLVQYGKANFANDAEIYDVINPSNSPLNARKGVLCENPKIVIRNGGSNELKKCEIRYRVGGGDIRVLKWSGGLAFMEMVEVEIPINDEGFYKGSGSNLFNVKVCNPNGVQDENIRNDEITVGYNVPEVYPAKIVVRLITNNNPGDNYYQIKDITGNIVMEKKTTELAARQTYSDTLNVDEGCYSLYLHDSGHNGLNYWANSSQGNGVLQFMILDSQGNLTGVKTFPRDFGRSIKHSFSINKKLGEFALKSPSGNNWECSKLLGNEEYSYESNISLFPNPSNGNVSVELFNLKGEYDLTVYSSMGRVVYQGEVKSDGYIFKELNLVGQASGIYILQLKGNEGVQTRRFVIEGN